MVRFTVLPNGKVGMVDLTIYRDETAVFAYAMLPTQALSLARALWMSAEDVKMSLEVPADVGRRKSRKR